MGHFHVTIAFRQKGRVSIQDLESLIEVLDAQATNFACIDRDIFLEFSTVSVIQQRWENAKAYISYLEMVSIKFLEFMELVEVQRFDVMGDASDIQYFKDSRLLEPYGVKCSVLEQEL